MTHIFFHSIVAILLSVVKKGLSPLITSPFSYSIPSSEHSLNSLSLNGEQKCLPSCVTKLSRDSAFT